MNKIGLRYFFSLLTGLSLLSIFDSPSKGINSQARFDQVLTVAEDLDKPNNEESVKVVAPSQVNLAEYDYIIAQFDGNNNDPDDIAALPIAAMLARGAELQNKTTFFYNNNLSENNNPSRVEKMRKSAAFAEKLGIDTVDYQQNINAATDKLVNIFNSGSKVFSIEGGPMEAVYRALVKTSSKNRAQITLLSHSGWNENRDVINRSGVTEARTWSDLKRDFPEVTFLEIDDQNPGFYNDDWNWLDNTNNPIFSEARDLMISSNKRNDPSDAGMLFYALTGKENANPKDAKDFWEDNPPSWDNNPTPSNPSLKQPRNREYRFSCQEVQKYRKLRD